LPRPSVCLSVGPEIVLWQNGRLDPDAIWGGEWGRSRTGVLDGVVIVEREGAVLGEFEVSHCNQWGLCNALFSNCFDDLLLSSNQFVTTNFRPYF